MPVYTYQCFNCGLRFKKTVKFVKKDTAQKCGCGSSVNRAMPDSCSFSFKSSPDQPPNSGVSSMDKKIDRIIGADAERGWMVVDSRDVQKREILRAHPDKTKSDISINDDGSYRILKPEEKEAGRKARKLHETAMHIIEEAVRQ